jgi:hypothetical protein
MDLHGVYKFHESPWNSMDFHGISMEVHGIPFRFQGTLCLQCLIVLI